MLDVVGLDLRMPGVPGAKTGQAAWAKGRLGVYGPGTEAKRLRGPPPTPPTQALTLAGIFSITLDKRIGPLKGSTSWISL